MKWTTVCKNTALVVQIISQKGGLPSGTGAGKEYRIPDPQHCFQVGAAGATKLSPVPGCFFVPPQCAVTTRITDTQLEMMKWDRVKPFYAGQRWNS
jgi:hypothetical protein